MIGTRGIWKDGWKASAIHAPLTGHGRFDEDRWELYHVDEDRSESNDLAASHPEKLKELIDTWFSEAERNHVLPLDDRAARDQLTIERPQSEPPRSRYVYYPHTSAIAESVAVNVRGRSYTSGELTPGKHALGMEFIREDAGEHGESLGTCKLYIDDQVVAEGPMRAQLGKFSLGGDGLCVGYDNGDPVSAQYASPFTFTGTLLGVGVDVSDEQYLGPGTGGDGRSGTRISTPTADSGARLRHYCFVAHEIPMMNASGSQASPTFPRKENTMGFWDFFWYMIWAFFFVAYLMVLFSIIGDIFRDHKLNGWFKAIWIAFLIFVPFLTALVYLIARGRGMAERSAASAQQAKDATDAYIRQAAGKSPSDEIADAAKLLTAGTITTEEYEKLKAKALA